MADTDPVQVPVHPSSYDVDRRVTARATPLEPTDGADGDLVSEQDKADANVWEPFTPPSPEDLPGYVPPAPATRTHTTGDDAAVIAAGPADY